MGISPCLGTQEGFPKEVTFWRRLARRQGDCQPQGWMGPRNTRPGRRLCMGKRGSLQKLWRGWLDHGGGCVVGVRP